MKRRVLKYFSPWNFEKEEIWLNNMSAHGWQLIKTGFFYTFEYEVSKGYHYRAVYLGILPKSTEYVPYFDLLIDSGAEFVTTRNNKSYFRRNSAVGPFSLYSDIDTLSNYLKKMYREFALPLIIGLLIYIFLLSVSDFTNWKNYIVIFAVALFYVYQLYGIIKLRKKINRLRRERLVRE